tara:strand:+ start:7469 stop:7651 length:183 start_codon:yes stop_codon:yes gene_type:complete
MVNKKTLQSNEVIESITLKIQLKKALREHKKLGETRKAALIQLKIDQIEDKLKSSPLSKT